MRDFKVPDGAIETVCHNICKLLDSSCTFKYEESTNLHIVNFYCFGMESYTVMGNSRELLYRRLMTALDLLTFELAIRRERDNKENEDVSNS